MQPGAVYAPYVSLTFAGGHKITVGNESSPKTNLATITSFELGLSPGEKGYGCDVEIIDVGGSMYKDIIKAINKTIELDGKDYGNVRMDWGWIIKNTDGSIDVVTAFTTTGIRFHGQFQGLETNFEGGNVKIKMQIRGVQSKELDSSHAGAEGASDQLMDLSTALQKLFVDYAGFAGVAYRDEQGAIVSPEKFFNPKDGGTTGPKAVWPMHQSNAFTIARMWLASITTQKGKGIIIIHEPDTNRIIFAEDPSTSKCCADAVASFVVNGGNCSPVISFNPSINWPKGMIPSGGGTAGGASSGQSQNIIKQPPNKENAGTQSAYGIQQSDWDFRVPEDHAAGMTDASNKHSEAAIAIGSAVGGGKPGWTAELKIIGDPRFCNVLGPAATTNNTDPKNQPPVTQGLFGKSVAIIFINPFYVGSKDKTLPISATNTSWIQESPCNEFITNKKYLITGVSHQISSGSYTTTFSLKLLLPNVELPADAGLGWCGPKVTEGLDGMQGESKPGDPNNNGK